MNGKNYLKFLGFDQLFGTQRTKEILSVNPNGHARPGRGQ
jgi:hypothetical protein